MIKTILFALSLAMAHAAPSLIAHTVISGVTSGTTPAIDTTGATFIVLHYSWSTGAITPSDSKSNTQTALAIQTSNGSSQINYIANPIVGTGHTFSFTGTNVFCVLTVQAWSGIVTTSPFSTQNGNLTLSATTLATGTVTPPPGGLVITGFHVENSTAAYSVDSSFTISDQVAFNPGVNYGGAMAYKISSTNENATWSCNGTGGRLAVTIATFIPISATGPKHQVSQ